MLARVKEEGRGLLSTLHLKLGSSHWLPTAKPPALIMDHR